MLLWKSIVANPLLAKTTVVLFLNKVDIFKAKLAAGIELGRYIVSYGNRPNDYESTSTCAYCIAWYGPQADTGDRRRSPEKVCADTQGTLATAADLLLSFHDGHGASDHLWRHSYLTCTLRIRKQRRTSF